MVVCWRYVFQKVVVTAIPNFLFFPGGKTGDSQKRAGQHGYRWKPVTDWNYRMPLDGYYSKG